MNQYYIDVLPADYERHGKFWTPPIFDTGDYGGAMPIAVSFRDVEVPDNTLSGFFDFVTKPVGKAVKAVGKVGGDIIHTANTAAKAVTKPVAKIPVIGTLARSAMVANPLALQADLAKRVGDGERLDQAFIAAARTQIAALKDVAPYAQFVLSFVPGVGTGVAAAMAAGVALAEGRTITDAVLSAVAAGVPGGTLARGVFDSGVALMSGKGVVTAALKLAKAKLPPAAYAALEASVKVAKGKDPKVAIMRALRAALPKDQQRALDIAVAMGTARNIQAATLNAVSNPAVLNKIAAAAGPVLKSPNLARVASSVAANAKHGAAVAAGLLGHEGVNAHALVTARAALKAADRVGFDAITKAAANASNPSHTTLVTRGMMLRGNWKAAKSNDPDAVRGRLVVPGKAPSSLGFYKRVG